MADLEKQLSRVQSGQGVVKGKGKSYGTGGKVQDRQTKMEDLEELCNEVKRSETLLLFKTCESVFGHASFLKKELDPLS